MDFKQAFTEAISRDGVSLERIAADLGVNYQTAWRWSKGRGEPSVSQFRTMKRLLPSLEQLYSEPSERDRAAS